MHRTMIALTAMGMTCACATALPASLEDRTLSYGCSDTVVVGTVENGAYEASPSDDDLIGHGSISATLHVRRVVSGGAIPTSLPVKYFAHTYMRDDRDFMFVLTPVDGGFEIATAQLMSMNPRAVRACP
jgi:hypothetical protein